MAIVVTGAAGFIGSCLVSFLNLKGLDDLILVDDFTDTNKLNRISRYNYSKTIDRTTFLDQTDYEEIDFVFHIGARTDTAEMDVTIFNTLNLNYSKQLWAKCCQNQIPMIYASSAATYGDGTEGFEDNHKTIHLLKPLNPYGQSKQDFDLWVLAQTEQPPFWCGLKFFNVFGPNEYHKNRMASVVFHAFNQIKDSGSLKLFKSHNPAYNDGEQLRDFIYIKDLLELIWFWYKHPTKSGIYNAGTGKAETFLSLANAIFKAMKISSSISFVPTPIDIRDKYQYFTEANMDKTVNAGFSHQFLDIDASVSDYIVNYLLKNEVY